MTVTPSTTSAPADSTKEAAPAATPLTNPDPGADSTKKRGRARSVIPSPDREPQGSADVVDPEEPDIPNADLVHAGHHHVSGLGPDNTPAGSHVHGPGDTPHTHLPPPPPPDGLHVQPSPVATDDDAREATTDSTGSWTVDHDCKAIVDGQVVVLVKGQRVSGRVGQHLAKTGAPVTSSK